VLLSVHERQIISQYPPVMQIGPSFRTRPLALKPLSPDGRTAMEPADAYAQKCDLAFRLTRLGIFASSLDEGLPARMNIRRRCGHAYCLNRSHVRF